ncbi:hypothetical protein [Streptomyces sp. NPDC019507]|uniref:hypothetical protein n=1 Tax=Streptomyces sp. NPDC019507 TaxID=3154689 RepID=UPI0033EA5EC1
MIYTTAILVHRSGYILPAHAVVSRNCQRQPAARTGEGHHLVRAGVIVISHADKAADRHP